MWVFFINTHHYERFNLYKNPWNWFALVGHYSLWPTKAEWKITRKRQNYSAQGIAQRCLAKSKIIADSLAAIQPLKLKAYKKNAHASYYHQKFNGKRTSSGVRFDNTKYTAAHRKFPFGTKLKITNEANHKSVIVEVIDRGPFSKGREIDLTKKAFMEIVDNKNSGKVMVTIEEIIPVVVPAPKP